MDISEMDILAAVLVAKIAFTILLWAGPLLLFPEGWLVWLGFPKSDPRTFRYLLGMAFLSLAYGYSVGLENHLEGRYPEGPVLVGILSNGGSFVLLAVFRSEWKEWGKIARAIMWVSLCATGAIAASLVWFGPLSR